MKKCRQKRAQPSFPIRLADLSCLPHPVGGLHAHTAEHGKVGQHLHGPMPVAVPVQGGVGDFAHTADTHSARLVGHGYTAQIVAADRDAGAAELTHLVAEKDRTELVPAVHQTAENQVRHRDRNLHLVRLKTGGAVKAQGDPIGRVARGQQMVGGQLLVVGDAGPGVMGGVAGDRFQYEGVVVNGPHTLRLLDQKTVQDMADRFHQPGDMHFVTFTWSDRQLCAGAPGIVQPGTGEGDRPIPGVELPGHLAVPLVDLAQNFGVDGPSQRRGQASPARCGKGEDGGEESTHYDFTEKSNCSISSFEQGTFRTASPLLCNI